LFKTYSIVILYEFFEIVDLCVKL
jgi:hypothetical protein